MTRPRVLISLRAAALVALVACSPSVVSVPSSLPAVKIDRSLQGPVCSREAAEVIAALRTRERGDLGGQLIDCHGDVEGARAAAVAANKRAAANAWWGTWGGLLALGAAIVFGGAGFAAGFAIAK